MSLPPMGRRPPRAAAATPHQSQDPCGLSGRDGEAQRNLLKGQALNTKSPFEYIDMSVKDAYDSDWKSRVKTRIRRSDGAIVLVSKNSLTSSGQKWEIQCAKEENVKILGIWAYTTDRTEVAGITTRVWKWDTIATFIDSL